MLRPTLALAGAFAGLLVGLWWFDSREPIVASSRGGPTLVTGVTVDSNGRPIGSTVAAYTWSGAFFVQAASEDDFDGLEDPAFAIRAPGGGPFYLLAAAGDSGTGVLREVRPGPDGKALDLEVVIEGPGIVRGRVVDRAGAPADALSVIVLRAGSQGDGSEGDRDQGGPTRVDFERGGRKAVELVTDANGAFEVHGLRDDRFVVAADLDFTGPGYEQVLTPESVRPDGEPLLLTVDRPHLRFAALDANGLPVELSSRLAHEAWHRALRVPNDWPETPVLLLRSADQDGAPEADPPDWTWDTFGGVDLARVLELQAGREVVARVVGGGFDGRARTAEVPAGGGRTVEFRPDATELGTVAVWIDVVGTDPESGEPLRPTATRVVLEALDGGQPLVARPHVEYPAQTRLRAPSGRYRVVAEGTTVTEPPHGNVVEHRRLGRAAEIVEVRADETTELELTLEPCGWIALTTSAPDGTTDLAVQVELRAPEQRPEPLWFPPVPGSHGVGAAPLTRRLPIGRNARSEGVPAGQYEAIATRTDGRRVRREIVVRAGETSALDVVFD